MIISRSPLRISLGGGGTDLPSYYRQYGGSLISAAIDKYVYVTVIRPFLPGIYLKYSKLERVDTVDEVQHPIIREAIRILDFKTPQLEISTLADIPSGTGLGSSSSFTTALLKALYHHRRRLILAQDLAAQACEIEINRLREPIGKQDQYISAYGEVTCFEFNKDDSVESRPLQLSIDALYELEENLLLFFTGFERSAGEILREQDTRSKQLDTAMIENLHHVKDLGQRSKRALEEARFGQFAEIMNEHWVYKRKRSTNITNPKIEEWYDLGLQNGAIGGKLVGADGGGFLMFYAEDRNKLRHALRRAGLEEVRFKFDFEGTKIVWS